MAIADAWIHVICLRDWLIKKAPEEEEEEAEIRGLASCNAGSPYTYIASLVHVGDSLKTDVFWDFIYQTTDYSLSINTRYS